MAWLAACRIGVLGLALLGSGALAQSEGLRVDGFGTLALYRADDPVTAFRADPRNRHGSRDGDWRSDGDTLASVQLSQRGPGRTEAVLQLLSKDDVERRYRP